MLLLLVVLYASGTIVAAPSDGLHCHGIVRDSINRSPIADAVIRIIGTSISRRTGSDGRFDIANLSPGYYRIGIRRLGYYDRIVGVLIERDTTIEIFLRPLALETAPVLIEGERGMRYPTEHAIQLDTRTLDRHRGQTFGELIEEIPGVSLLRTGPTIAKPVIRGMHSFRVVTVENGIQHQAQEWGLDHAPAIDPFLPSSIAIVSGAASIEESYAAIGGVIRIESAPLRYHLPLQGKVSLIGATNNWMGAASVRAQAGDIFAPNTAALVQISAFRAGDSQSPRYVLSNTGAQQWSGLAAFGYEHSRWRHEIRYSIFAAELGILAASHIGNYNDLQRAIAAASPLIIRPWTYTISNPRQEIVHHALQWQSIYASEGATLEIRYGWQRNDRREYDAHNARFTDSAALQRALQQPAIELSLASYQLDIRFRQSQDESPHVLGIHLLRQANVRSGRVFLIPDYTLYEGGVFAVKTWTLGKWITSIGARGDMQWLAARPYNKATGSPLPDTTMLFHGIAAHAGIERLFGNIVELQINLATHWRAPTSVELFANDLHHGTAQYEIGNRRLGTERSLSLDLHTKTFLGTATLQLSGYGIYLTRFTQLLPDSQPTITYRGVFPTMRYSQNTAMIAGAEIEATLPMGRFFRWDLQIAFTRGYNLQTNQPLLFMPADRGRIALHCHLDSILGIDTFYADVALNAVRRQTLVPRDVFDYAPPPPGYATVNVRVGGELIVFTTRLSIMLDITNVLNTPYRDYLSRYRYFALDPGRNLTFRVMFPFGMSHFSPQML